MPEQYEPSAAAPKSVKLRESCDSCLVAKVKCSKGRPLCSRCLQNGSICGYSPSSRAGRKNRDSASTKVNPHKSHASLSRSNRSAPTPPFSSAMSRPSSSSENVQSQATNENGMKSSTTLGALDDQVSEAPAAENRVPTTLGGGSVDNFLPTPPFNDFLDTLLPLSPEVMFAELASAATSPGTCTAPSSTIPAWTSNGGDGTSSAPIPTSQGPLDRASFANFSQSQSHGRTSLPDLHDRRHHSADATIIERPTCDCFAACLQALLSLHNHSWTTPSAQQGGPPFDVILSITRGAIEGGSAMLSCSKCVAKIGSGISTMLLATIFGKVMSLYRAACFFRFGAASGIHASAQLAFGSFTVTGEDRQLLEIEILLIELRKVENVLKVFQEKFDSSQAEKDETSVYHALTSYLEKNLYYIVQFLQARKQNLPRLSNGGR